MDARRSKWRIVTSSCQMNFQFVETAGDYATYRFIDVILSYRLNSLTDATVIDPKLHPMIGRLKPSKEQGDQLEEISNAYDRRTTETLYRFHNLTYCGSKTEQISLSDRLLHPVWPSSAK